MKTTAFRDAIQAASAAHAYGLALSIAKDSKQDLCFICGRASKKRFWLNKYAHKLSDFKFLPTLYQTTISVGWVCNLERRRCVRKFYPDKAQQLPAKISYRSPLMTFKYFDKINSSLAGQLAEHTLNNASSVMKHWLACKRNKLRAVVVYEDGKIIGWSACLLTKEPQLSVFIDKAYRRRGLASVALDRLLYTIHKDIKKEDGSPYAHGPVRSTLCSLTCQERLDVFLSTR
jgi:hypothetical protein